MTPRAKKLTYEPDYAVPPGATLLEALEEKRMTQAELARQLLRPRKSIQRLITGEARLTAEIAHQLEVVLHIPAHFWLNREARYREALAQKKREVLF